MKKSRIGGEIAAVVLLILIPWLHSCDVQEQWMLEVPAFDNNSALKGATSLSGQTMYALEGIYKVINGNEAFGDTVVLKQTKDKISLFGLKEGCYAILDAGSISKTIVFEGYWRHALNDKIGLLRLSVQNADNLLQGDTTLVSIQLQGEFGNDQALPAKPVTFQLVKKFSATLRADQFIIGAHRAGGRTSDKLPVSENSIAMINYTEYLGTTGIEVDVQLTLDKVPVLYHDDDLNIRLIQKGPLYGRIQDYKFAQLRTLVKLIHGEDIPSLEEAFEAVLNNTRIKFIWLDIKDAESLKIVIPMQQKCLALAKKAGRDLRIVVGIPSDEVYNAFLSYKGYLDVTSLCELSTDQVSAINAKAWAFRWTMGLQEQEVIKMHEQGRKCLVWTLDVPAFTKIYATQGGTDPAKRFDGILTNYPTILAYFHYVRHNF
jgi:glycerophosphoryl diester phosphodiesterase